MKNELKGNKVMKKSEAILLSIIMSCLTIFPLAAQPLQVHAPFNESVWRVEYLSQQKKFIKHYQNDLKFTYLSFNPYTHKVNGSGLCNKFLASFQNDQNQIVIKNIKQQKNTCADEKVNRQDELFFTYLKSVRFIVLNGKYLNLLDENKKLLITAKFFK